DDASVVPPSDWPIPRQLSRYVQSVKVRHKGSRARSTMVGDAGADHTVRVESLEGELDRGSPELCGVTPSDIRGIYQFPEEWDGAGETIALLMLGCSIETRDLHEFWTAHGIKPPEVNTVHVGSRPDKAARPN